MYIYIAFVRFKVKEICLTTIELFISLYKLIWYENWKHKKIPIWFSVTCTPNYATNIFHFQANEKQYLHQKSQSKDSNSSSKQPDDTAIFHTTSRNNIAANKSFMMGSNNFDEPAKDMVFLLYNVQLFYFFGKWLAFFIL